MFTASTIWGRRSTPQNNQSKPYATRTFRCPAAFTIRGNGLIVAAPFWAIPACERGLQPLYGDGSFTMAVNLLFQWSFITLINTRPRSLHAKKIVASLFTYQRFKESTFRTCILKYITPVFIEFLLSISLYKRHLQPLICYRPSLPQKRKTSAYNGCFENYAIQEFIDEKIDAPKTVSSQGKYAEKGI